MKEPKARKRNPAVNFDLEEFLPYLLNQAAEATSLSFQSIYAEKFGMTRTQWRVLANLGKFGSMTAKDICTISHIEKTKVSRAIAVLEEAGMLQRATKEEDRRAEKLQLTTLGASAYQELGKSALDYNGELKLQLGLAISNNLRDALKMLIRHRTL